jgi:hypothetical protein
MVVGVMDLTRPCLHQAALLWKVPVCQVQRELRNVNGGNGNGGNGHGRKAKLKLAERLKADLKAASPAELEEVGREVGIDQIWDRLISPVIASERTASSK